MDFSSYLPICFGDLYRFSILDNSVASSAILASAAPSRGTKRAKPKLENLQTPKPQPAPHTLPGQPQNRGGRPSGLKFPILFRF